MADTDPLVHPCPLGYELGLDGLCHPIPPAPGGGGAFQVLPPPPVTVLSDAYRVGRDDFALLLIRKHYPERTDNESAVIRAYLLDHLYEFDSIFFGKRVGRGVTPD